MVVSDSNYIIPRFGKLDKKTRTVPGFQARNGSTFCNFYLITLQHNCQNCLYTAADSNLRLVEVESVKTNGSIGLNAEEADPRLLGECAATQLHVLTRAGIAWH